VTIDGGTYAEYARQGFFQLLAVSTLTAVMVWVAMLWLRPLTGYRRAMFRAVCTFMILMTGVILASALKRLGLYEEAYGYTRMRLLSHVFTFWIAGVLMIVLAQVYTGRLELLPVGAVALGFVVLFGLNLMNPDGYIAAHNLDRDTGPTKVGAVSYVKQLTSDAVPSVVSRWNSLTSEERHALADWACGLRGDYSGWREWNVGARRGDRASTSICAVPANW
jgi:hypothetical protein